MVKNPLVNAGDLRDKGSVPGSGRSPGEGCGHPLQYSCLENPMDRGAWRAPVHSIAKRREWSNAAHATHTYFFTSVLCLPINCNGFPGGSAGKESACNAGDLGLIPGLGRSPGEGKGYSLQYSGLENSMDLWVTKSRTRLSDFYVYYCYPGLLGALC